MKVTLLGAGLLVLLFLFLLLALLRMRNKAQCDGCMKKFPPDSLDPHSGDYWLCAKCYKEWDKP